MNLKPRIDKLGQASFALQGEVAELVTFLNKTLKDRDLIFGITRDKNEESYQLTIYLVVEVKEETKGKEE